MIVYYRIKSPLSQASDTRMSRFVREVEDALGEELRQTGLDTYLQAPFALLYVASGGSEGYFLEVFERLKDRECYILTSGEANSLAASMEILSYLKQNGGAGRILHGDPVSVAEKIRALCAAHRAMDALRGRKLGCIGKPSDWLIASRCDPAALERKLGLRTADIPMEELLSEIGQRRYEENAYTARFKALPFDPAEVEKALWIYGAVKRLTERHGLSGVSVRCFDLLDTVHSTGCLALSILNSEGICAACEGDMPALLSMAVLKSLTGEDLFMCNPSRFDTKEGTATFAHCTLPVTMPARFCLNTHFESGIGAAVQGSFDPGSCTLFKCAGDLSRYYVCEGEILETPFSDMLCRTQVRVRLDDFTYFLTDPIGNHHILCKGKHAAEVMAFFELLNAAKG
ncbi:MAG: hypothetical protein J6Z38_08760 [Lachnospiraceae bacterium]|nr:hypothetical protein [Lachnospiraceae bacterium]